jgi:hypothetical protein
MLRVSRVRLTVGLAVGLAILVIVAPVGAGSGVVTVASGLDNPRGLDFTLDGSLYVAEAGRGGSAPCFPGPEGDEVCFGQSGAVTKIANGRQSRVLTGLPSIAAEDGSGAIGPSDVSFPLDLGPMYVTFGLGANPAIRSTIPELAPMDRLVRRHPPFKDSWVSVADIGEYETAANPDGGAFDSNPNSVFATIGGEVVADAGGNALLWVSWTRKVSTLATFPDRMVDAPPFLGLPPGTQIPMQAVPTSVVRGPDGAFYVGQLTGFPFPVGGANVYRIVPGKAPQVFASGFTNIIDIAFGPHGRLYVLEIAHNSLLSGDPTGALIRVNANGTRDVLMSDGLIMPGGLAIRGQAAYVSNCGVCAGTGSVLRIGLS